jgi:hypothetical protein
VLNALVVAVERWGRLKKARDVANLVVRPSTRVY